MTGRVNVWESEGSPLAKRWTLAPDGRAEKTTAAQLYSGTYSVREFKDVHGLAEVVGGTTTQQAISASTPADGSVSGRVVPVRLLADNPEAKARTKKEFVLQGPSFGLIDCDEAGITRDELVAMLHKVAPGLAGAGAVWLPSGSSHICHGDKDLTGLRGQHIYVMVKDVADWPRVLKVLARRLWLAEHGSVKVSKSGAVLTRCPVDTAVGDCARLVFSGGAIAVAPLEQRRGKPVVLSEGGFLDTAKAIPDLADEEVGRYEALVAKAKAEVAGEAAVARAAHRSGEVARRLPELMAKGMGAAEAERVAGEVVDAALSGTLLGDFLLTVVHDGGRQEVVSVNQVLSDPERYNECDCLDPINPEHRGGAADARLFLLSASPIVYSLDDGGKVFRLRRQKVRLAFASGQRVELVDQLVSIASANDSVFMTDTGPILLDQGRLMPLTAPRLMNLLGREVTLCRVGSGGEEAPCDLPREVADLVLSALYR